MMNTNTIEDIQILAQKYLRNHSTLVIINTLEEVEWIAPIAMSFEKSFTIDFLTECFNTKTKLGKTLTLHFSKCNVGWSDLDYFESTDHYSHIIQMTISELQQQVLAIRAREELRENVDNNNLAEYVSDIAIDANGNIVRQSQNDCCKVTFDHLWEILQEHPTETFIAYPTSKPNLYILRHNVLRNFGKEEHQCIYDKNTLTFATVQIREQLKQALCLALPQATLIQNTTSKNDLYLIKVKHPRKIGMSMCNADAWILGEQEDSKTLLQKWLEI